jgi:aldehyde:ferredoxin oxidoreductase
MEYLSTDKILVIDLNAREVEEEELDEDLVSKKIGGIGITKFLYEKYEAEDPIVIGTGLLTGTTYPASGACQITAKSPVTQKLCHCPVIYKLGVEIKYSGFDYIVVKGSSPSPVYLWIHDGVADISDATDIWGKDVWESTDALRTFVGDDLLQTMMIGPAGENGSDYAQVCYNHWSSPDRFGLGKLFGTKNLKGVAFRGMGLIEVAEPEDFVERSLEILKEIKKNAFLEHKGVAKILGALGEEGISDWLDPVTHRHTADYFSPYATNTAIFMDEDPGLLEESKEAEPAVLVSDIYALLQFKNLGLSARDTGRALKACAKQGIDPFAVATLGGKKSYEEIIGSFDSLEGKIDLPGKGIFTPWCPTGPIFNDFDLSGDDEKMAWWERRQAVSMIFGIQPMFSLMCPELTEENMLGLASIGTDLELTQETLDDVIDTIFG